MSRCGFRELRGVAGYFAAGRDAIRPGHSPRKRDPGFRREPDHGIPFARDRSRRRARDLSLDETADSLEPGSQRDELPADEIDPLLGEHKRRRDQIRMPHGDRELERSFREAAQDEVETIARDTVAGWLEGKQIVKTVVVPGRRVNFVVK